MASVREQIWPHIAAKNLVLAFPLAYRRIHLKELVFQIVSNRDFIREEYTHTCALACRFHRQIEVRTCGFVTCPMRFKTYTAVCAL